MPYGAPGGRYKGVSRDAALIIPDDLDFDEISGLSNEVHAKPTKAWPATIAAARYPA